ncbi:MAG: xanthine dehydrogenase family protein molybdopterin-binding subunit [Planctomycetes bacterium]|nr:xanthine dehydrogenase family protein molybdopterin-binding subunit [Planctomycetota bacterium]
MTPRRPALPPSTTPYTDRAHPVVGQPCRSLDGVEKVTGAQLYGADLIPGRAELFAVSVRTEQAHARVLSIDTAAARAVEGVVGVYLHGDVAGTNRHGLIRRDHPVLAEDRVRYLGDVVALVVAETEAAAHKGSAAVRVEYEPLPVIADIDAALADGAYALYPDGNVMGGKRIRKGDADAALASADVVVTGTFQTQTVDHAFLDLESGIARYDSTGDGLLTIQASGQWVHEERRLIALALGLEPEHIRIIQPATGGAFGGREDLSIQLYLGLAALKHPDKTVAVRYDRAESMRARHKRHALRIEYTLGADRDGTLTAAKVIVWSDEGAYASTGPAVMRKASSHATGPYRVPNVSVDVYGIHTNNNPTGAMRGFGACQMAIAYEGVMDRLAKALDCDRYELRRKNLIHAGDAVTTGQHMHQATVDQCLEAAMDRFVRHDPDGHVVVDAETRVTVSQPPEPHLRRGYGMSAICFGLGYGDGFPDCARARVAFDEQGRLVVYTGGVDVGQGFDNMVAQIAADELGLELAGVRVVAADTALTSESGSSSATRQTYFSGNAVKMAAEEVKEQLLDIAGTHLRVHPHEIELTGGWACSSAEPERRVSVADLVTEGRKRGYSLDARTLFKPRTVCEDFDTGQSPRAFVTYLFGAHVSQVLVDVETGAVKVERHIACHDVGKAINPQAVEGQIAGGVAQGIGMALMEEVITRNGRILNANFTDYILPTVFDVPTVECIILENDDPGGPFGARGIGEPPLIGAVPAVLSAIADAIGVAPTHLPCTPERIWRLLQEASGKVDEH